MTFWGMVYLVIAANPKDPLIKKVKAASEWGDEHGVFDRVMKAAG